MSTDSIKHTPGPWLQSHRKQEDGMYSTQIYDAAGETIADIAWYPVDLGNGVTGTARSANAKLIAAAPEMLSALKAVELLGNRIPRDVREQVEAAISKAEEGKS